MVHFDKTSAVFPLKEVEFYICESQSFKQNTNTMPVVRIGRLFGKG